MLAILQDASMAGNWKTQSKRSRKKVTDKNQQKGLTMHGHWLYDQVQYLYVCTFGKTWQTYAVHHLCLPVQPFASLRKFNCSER